MDNHDGQGVNYIGERLHLADMHPADVFIDSISDAPVCIIVFWVCGHIVDILLCNNIINKRVRHNHIDLVHPHIEC